MNRPYLIIAIFLFLFKGWSQKSELPTDFRQHTLTQFNSSLFNPTFSFDRDFPRSISLWSRWQWQSIDGDPTTLFVNYAQRLNKNLSGGLGFLQHNTGTYLQTGFNLNVAFSSGLDDNTTLIFGANVFSFGQELADDQFERISINEIRSFDADNSFSTQISPGIRLESKNFNLGLAVQNALSLTLSGPSNSDNDTAVSGFISNDFPIRIFGGDSFLRPQFYVNAVSGFDAQVGLNALLSHPNFWVQSGYNSFFGASMGVGVTIAERMALGGLMEFATDDSLMGEGNTFELTVSYLFGKQNFEKKEPEMEETPFQEEESTDDLPEPEEAIIQKEEPIDKTEPAETNNQEDLIDKEPQKEPVEAIEEKENVEKELSEPKVKRLTKRQLRLLEKRRQDSIQQVLDAERIAEMEKRRLDSISQLKQEQLRIQARADSIARAKARKIALSKEKSRKDSIAALELNKEVELLPNERYEEVTKEEGLQPGFYLIANVFGTKKYYENFMKTLKGQGLSPGSFYRNSNKFNYVYLKRYNSINDARKARDSKFDGKYKDKLWILRIR